MTRHSTLVGDQCHEPKGADTAQEGQVYVADGAGGGGFQFIGASNVVVVESEADLPDPVGGVITLADNTVYTLVANITLQNRIQTGSNSCMESPVRGSVTLSYNGNDTLFTGADNDNFRLCELVVSAPSATLFAFNGTAGNANGGFNIMTCTLTAASVGTMTNINSFTSRDTTFNLTLGGLVLAGTDINPVLRIEDTSWNQVVGTCIDLGVAVLRALRINFCAFFGADFGISSAGTANMFMGSTAKIRDAAMIVTTPLTGGVSNASVRWVFLNCTGIGDTAIAGNSYLDVAETVTITAANTYEPIGGGNWTANLENYFSADANGVLTFAGEAETVVEMLGTGTIEKDGGGTEPVAMRIAINGTTLPESTGQTENGQPTSVTCAALVTLQPGDTVQLYVANTVNTDDVDVEIANLLVTRVP